METREEERESIEGVIGAERPSMYEMCCGVSGTASWSSRGRREVRGAKVRWLMFVFERLWCREYGECWLYATSMLVGNKFEQWEVMRRGESRVGSELLLKDENLGKWVKRDPRQKFIS
jgi:hypothetical protein